MICLSLGPMILLDPVPAGRSRIVLMDPLSADLDPSSWRTLLDLDLKAGETKVLTLP